MKKQHETGIPVGQLERPDTATPICSTLRRQKLL